MKNQYSFPAAATQDLYEYLLVVHPDPSVNKKVMEEAQFFADEYSGKIAIKNKPYITVANIVAREPMEETITRWMQRIFSQQQSFTVTLNNYSGFPAHTIYLRVQNAHTFQQLAKELRVIDTYISSCSCPSIKVIAHPHLSIASRLSEDVYFKALAAYAHKSFHESFAVNELRLLRRKHQYDSCKAINVFGLQPATNNVSVN